MIRNLVVLGGGSAGLLAALSLKARLPHLAVRVVHSREIGIIGVGEGSTGDLPNHLHGFLGIDPADFHTRARPTWKLGVHFEWGPRPSFDYTFTKTFVGAAPGLPRLLGYYAWEDCAALDPNSARMWDEIRDFLAIHCRYNTRLDTPFWQHCRRATALHGAEPIVRYYEENGPSTAFAGYLLTPETSIFHLEGFYALLLGQRVPHRCLRPPTAAEQQALATLRATHLGQARRGFGVAESLALIRSPRWQWTPGFYQQ